MVITIRRVITAPDVGRLRPTVKNAPVDLARYRSVVALDEPRHIRADPDWRASIHAVIADAGLGRPPEPCSPEDALMWLRQRLAPVEPFELTDDVVARIESINMAVVAERGVISTEALPTVRIDPSVCAEPYPARDVVSIVVADITRLEADAIVNAANRWMLGCRVPGHHCIDNAIHAAAGPRLRDDCARIMAEQGELEGVGAAKVTRAHALPSRYVLHTVGPQLEPGSTPTEAERDQLRAAYRSCLDLAAEVDDIRTVAFCGISTGVFAFPADEAAVIALDEIARWVTAHPGRMQRIVIDCFREADAEHYREVLS